MEPPRGLSSPQWPPLGPSRFGALSSTWELRLAEFDPQSSPFPWERTLWPPDGACCPRIGAFSIASERPPPVANATLWGSLADSAASLVIPQTAWVLIYCLSSAWPWCRPSLISSKKFPLRCDSSVCLNRQGSSHSWVGLPIASGGQAETRWWHLGGFPAALETGLRNRNDTPFG